MDFRDAWLGMTREQRDALVARLETSYGYLQKLSGGFGVPSLEFAQKLKRELPALDMDGFIRAKEGAGKRHTIAAS